jgi:hypothetical protein
MATVEVPNEIIDSPNSKLKFITWDTCGASNPLSILVNSTLDVTASYNHAYPLSITSSYGIAVGSGWYTQGTNATFAVQSNIDYGNSTKRVFKQWEGDSNSTQNKAWTIINSPKQVNAFWTTQYAVTINTVGFPANASTVVFIGNNQVTLNGSLPYRRWVDASQQLPIQVQSTQIQTSSNNYVFSRLMVDNQTLTGALNVKKPTAVSIVYTATPKAGASIALPVSPSIAAPIVASDVVTRFLINIIAKAKSFTLLSPLISLAATMMTLGLVLTSLIIPGASPIIGHLMGSLFIGFIFIFPASTILVLLNAVRIRRGPSLRWLSPLLTLWLFSFTLVLLNPATGVLQPLAAASQPLLLLTTALLFPMMATFQLAKLVEN